MQIDLLVNAMANDMTRIGSLQYMRSVGQARMNWLGIKEGHHGLSHEPDTNKEAAEKLQISYKALLYKMKENGLSDGR